MIIIIKDGLDTWELTTVGSSPLNIEIEKHANECIKIAKKLIYNNPNTKTVIKTQEQHLIL